MFGYNITTLVIILAIALLLFGPRRLPELGDSIGKAIRSFKKAHEDPDSASTRAEIPPAPPRRRQSATCPHCQKQSKWGLRLLPPLRRQDEPGVINRSQHGDRLETLLILAVLGVYPLRP